MICESMPLWRDLTRYCHRLVAVYLAARAVVEDPTAAKLDALAVMIAALERDPMTVAS